MHTRYRYNHLRILKLFINKFSKNTNTHAEWTHSWFIFILSVLTLEEMACITQFKCRVFFWIATIAIFELWRSTITIRVFWILPLQFWDLSDCLSGKSTRGMPGGRFVGEEGIPEPRVGWLHDDARGLDRFGPLRSVIPYALCFVYCMS